MTSTADQVAELAKTGMTQFDIARRLSVTPQRVSQTAKRRGLPSRAEVLKQQLREECQGMTHTDAARHIGASVSVVAKWTEDLPDGFLIDGPGHGRGRSGGTKTATTKRIIEEAPALAKQGLSKSDAARRLGVSLPTFTTQVLRYLPHVKWHDWRWDGRGGRKRNKGDLLGTASGRGGERPRGSRTASQWRRSNRPVTKPGTLTLRYDAEAAGASQAQALLRGSHSDVVCSDHQKRRGSKEGLL